MSLVIFLRHLKGKTLGPKVGLFIASLLLAPLLIYSSFGIATNSTTLSSSGTIANGTPPTPSPRGEIFLWVGFWLTDDGGYTPNENGQRIVDAKTEYGNPTWIEAGNWGGPHLTSTLINFFHDAGINVSCRLWSRYSEVPLDTLKHDMDVANGYGGSVDYQMSIGPEIDMIMIDECSQDYAYYKELADYVHSKGKLFAVNPGGWTIQEQTCTYADKVSVEFDWRNFILNKQDLIAQYPNKFIGVSNDWGYQYYPPYGTVDLNRAVADTLEAWNGGVYYFESRPDGSYLPDWWEEYLSQL